MTIDDTEAGLLTADERGRLLSAYRDGVLAPGHAVLIEAGRIKADALREAGHGGRQDVDLSDYAEDYIAQDHEVREA